MHHELFGDLTYNDDDACWNGYRPLTHLAALGRRAARDDDDLEDDTPSAVADVPEAERRKSADQFAQLLGMMEEAMADDEDDFAEEEQEAEQERREVKALLDAERRRQGLFPVNVEDPDRKGPTSAQEAAFRHLAAHEQEVCDVLLDAMRLAYRQYDPKAGDDVRTAAHLLQLDVTREQHHGTSYLVFEVDCDWQDEHGLYLVYHKETGADWTDADGLYDLIEADEPVEEEDDPLPGNHELLAAVLAHNEKKVRKLIAEGHDINDVGSEPFPPLCLAVEQRDVDLVKRLLALGADPNLKDFDRQTALKRAKRMLKEVTPRKGDRLTEASTNLARKADPSGFADYREKLGEIILLLQEAGAK